MPDLVWDVLRIVGAIGAAVLLYLAGAATVRNFARAEPPPAEPEPGDLADVDYRYGCVVCGAQAVLYAAPDGQVPEAPRHCREPMALLAPVDDTGDPS